MSEVPITIKTYSDSTGIKDLNPAISELKGKSAEAANFITSLREALTSATGASTEQVEAIENQIEKLEEFKDLVDAKINTVEAATDAEENLGENIAQTDQKSEDAAASSKKLGAAQSQQGKQSQNAARSLDRLNQELAEARQKLSSAEIGTQQFTDAQKEVTVLERQRATAMRIGAKSTRNTGLAVLEASRALEDLQYGIRGVLNNIPQLILMLGGTAGLAGVISVVAVGIAQLAPLMQSQRSYTEELAAASQKLVQQKVKEAQAERALSDARKESLKQYEEVLKNESLFIDKQISKINELTEARLRERDVQQAIDDEQLALDLVKVDANTSLSNAEKFAQKRRFREDAANRKFKREKNQRESNIADAQKLITINKKRIAQGEEEIKRSKELSSKIGPLKDTNIELKATIKILEKTIERQIKAVEKRVDLDAFYKDGFSLDVPKRSDFESDEDFITATKARANENISAFVNTINHIGAVEDNQTFVKRLKDEYDKREKLIQARENRAQALASSGKSNVSSGQKSVKRLQKSIFNLESQGEIASATQPLIEERRRITGNQAQKQALIQDAQKFGGDLVGDLQKDLGEVWGKTREEINQRRSEAKQIQTDIAAILQDGIIDATEQAKVPAALAEFRNALNVNSGETLKNINSLINVVQQIIGTQKTHAAQIHNLGATLSSP